MRQQNNRKEDGLIALILKGASKALAKKIVEELDKLLVAFALLPITILVSFYQAGRELLTNLVTGVIDYVGYRREFARKCGFPIELVWIGIIITLTILLGAAFLLFRLAGMLMIMLEYAFFG